MRIEHIALWVEDLDQMKSFYETYFNATAGPRYTNVKKGFSSYFLSFQSGARIELMKGTDIHGSSAIRGSSQGLAHFAISTGSRRTVDELTERLRADGIRVVGNPRTTGDGYYESVIADPEGNLIEITI